MLLYFNVGTYASMLLDLHSSEKIKIEEHSQTPGHSKCNNELIIFVCDNQRTFSFLDRCIYNRLLKQSSTSESFFEKLKDLLSISDDRILHTCISNLTSRCILGTTKDRLGSFKKLPVVNIGPIQILEKEIKATCLKEKRPDSYILALLTFIFLNEKHHTFVDLLLQKICTPREIPVAKENLRTIVTSQGLKLRSPKFTRKKFSFEVPNKAYVQLNRQTLSPVKADPESPFGWHILCCRTDLIFCLW